MWLLLIILCVLAFHDFFIKLARFFYWTFKDIIYSCTHEKKVHLYGIWLFCGLYGQGKTMALTEYLCRMREKYKDKIYICTNYGFKDEDFPLLNWKDLLKEYDKPVIFAYDEIQNEFNSRDYRNFPYELVKLLTQNRKGHGKQIVGTAQRFCRVDKVIRELCSHVIECKTPFSKLNGRWTFTKRYAIDDYEMYISATDVNRKAKISKVRYSFIQTDKLRNSYDSFQMLDCAKSKEYLTIYEKNGIMTLEEIKKQQSNAV